MAYCTYCGSKIDEGTAFCPNCGARVEKTERTEWTDGAKRTGDTREDVFFAFTDGDTYTPPYTADTRPRKFVSVISFIFPLVGLIIWLTSRYTCEGRATSALKGLYAALCFSFPVIGIIFFFVWRRTRSDFAKIGLIFAIVGAALSFTFSMYQIMAELAAGLSGYTAALF